MSGIVTVVEGARQFLEGLTTTRGRLLASAAVLVLTVVVDAVVLPRTLDRVRRTVAERYVPGQVADAVDVFDDYAPRTLSELAVRTAQLAVVVVTILSLLVVWGLFDWAVVLFDTTVSAVPHLFRIGVTLGLLLVAVVGSDQIKRWVRRFSDDADRVTDHQQEIVTRVGQLTWFVTIGAAILTLWDANLGGLLVGAGFLGIVVGFAARQTLGSLIAGFVLMFSRPFTVGDWIEVGEDEGVVTDITIFNTRLENFDGEFVVIPNDKVTERAVTNRSGKGRLRLHTEVGVDYDADPARAMDVAEEAMASVDVVVDGPPPQVVPKEFGDSAILLDLRYWIADPTPPRKWQAVSGVVREVKAAFDDAGIGIPYPQRQLSGRDATGIEDAAGALSREAAAPTSGDGQSDADGPGGS